MARDESNTPKDTKEIPLKPGQSVTVDASAILALMDQAMEAKLEAMLAKRAATHIEPNDPTMRKLQEAERQNAEPKTIEYRPAQSPRTGARFTVKLVSSKHYPKGRIVDIGTKEDGSRDYVEPEEYTKHQDDGGLVPNNIPIRNAASGQFTREYMKWKGIQNNPWIIDLRDIVGAPWSALFEPRDLPPAEAR